MKIKLNHAEGRLTLYYEKWHVLFFQLIMGLITLSMGLVFFFYISQESKQQAFKWFGSFFSLIGIFLLFSLLKRYKNLKSNPTGDELVVISKSELKLSKGLGAETYTYSWKQIEKNHSHKTLLGSRFRW
jgi:Na+/melibiose symporter-like transporter